MTSSDYHSSRSNRLQKCVWRLRFQTNLLTKRFKTSHRQRSAATTDRRLFSELLNLSEIVFHRLIKQFTENLLACCTTERRLKVIYEVFDGFVYCTPRQYSFYAPYIVSCGAGVQRIRSLAGWNAMNVDCFLVKILRTVWDSMYVFYLTVSCLGFVGYRGGLALVCDIYRPVYHVGRALSSRSDVGMGRSVAPTSARCALRHVLACWALSDMNMGGTTRRQLTRCLFYANAGTSGLLIVLNIKKL